MKTEVSLVIPVYNSELLLNKLISEIEISLFNNNRTYEIILVNDGSKDNSWEELKNIVNKHKHITIINLLKNYGQHNAIFCGFHYAKGKYIVTLDDDLQNPPSEIEKMIKKIEEGYDVVFGKFYRKQHNDIRKLGTKIVGLLNTKIFNKPPNLTLSNFRIIKHEVIDRIIQYKTMHPYIPGLVLMFSDKVGNVMVEHKKREIGKSNYSFLKILKLVSTILFNYSTYPIRFVSILGFVIAFISFLLGIVYVFKNIILGVDVKGWTTLTVLLSFLSGYIILMLGMLGEYIGRMNIQLSQRKSFDIEDLIKSVE